MRQRLLIVLRSIPIGWAAMLLLAYLLEHPLLRLTAPILGAEWLATAVLGLHCLAMAATGWIVGRLNRAGPLLGILAFAATLAFCGPNTRLFRLALLAVRDSRYLGGLATLAASQTLVFVCLFAGGLLSRRQTRPLSIVS